MSTIKIVNGGVVPGFLDDNERYHNCQNDAPATAAIISKEIALANQCAHAGRPIYSFYGDEVPPTLVDNSSTYRQVYIAGNLGANGMMGTVLGLPHDTNSEGSDPGFQTGMGLALNVNGTSYLNNWNFSTSVTSNWPASATVQTLVSTFGHSSGPVEIYIGGTTTMWPQLRAGTCWQNPNNLAFATGTSYAGSSEVRPGGEIVGVNANKAQETMTELIASFRDTWYHQRPQVGWSLMLPGYIFDSTTRAITMNTSSQNYRYVLNQAFGTGGTNFGATAPAMTLPLHHAGAGMRTQVRVYVFVYAAMTGTTNTGTLAVANKDSGGTMATSATALTNGPTISGTTFQWYPSLSTWSATTGGYFLGYTGGAFDRVALCAKSSGATDNVMIGAFTYVVAPSTV